MEEIHDGIEDLSLIHIFLWPGLVKWYAKSSGTTNDKSKFIPVSHDIIVPSSKPDVRQYTTWIDSLHIKSIDQVNYTHFLPDNVVLLSLIHICR